VLVEVCFKGNRKEFFLWDATDPPPVKAAVVVEADRGEDLGHVHSIGELAEKRAAKCARGPGSEPVTRVVKRLASSDEVARLSDLREQDEMARRRASERVKANNLVMKLSDAEWRWDRRKLTIYFTAERRVDFRNLVRELAAMFRTRIELKQIGVRDEASRLGGIGRCGREYCSASWLPDLRPVNLGVAKDQRLSLNPSQISGACGRLMCCLRFEHDFYVKQRKRFPKEGRMVTTTRGEERVVSNDIFRERVTLRGADGETRVLALAEFRRDTGIGTTVEMPVDEDTPVIPMEALSDEVIRLQDTSERPMWRPRGSAEPTPQPRQLPVVSSDQLASVVEDEIDDGADDGDDAAEDETGEIEAPASAAESAAPNGTGEPRRGRRRRRGRRGGRRNRGGGDRSPPSGGSAPGSGGPA
jgi:cell fate regulator YaaT (PSP1 superfamily)